MPAECSDAAGETACDDQRRPHTVLKLFEASGKRRQPPLTGGPITGRQVKQSLAQASAREPFGNRRVAQGELVMSAFTFEAEVVPLRNDERGVIRVGDSGVSLDSVIREFRNGSCPEEIVCSSSDARRQA